MKQPILLDTCAAIFLLTDQLKPEALTNLEQAERDQVAIFVSPITAWEIGILVARGRLVLSTNPDIWFKTMIESGIALASMEPDILIASSFLPAATLRDPADRILAATARAKGYRLMTRDRPLLDYAADGHLKAIAC